MSDNRFDYPTAAAPTSSIVFDTAGHLADDAQEQTFNDEISETPSGTVYVRELGDDKSEFDFTVILPMSSATLYDKSDMIAFMATVKRTLTFQWTDENSTVRTVQNMSKTIKYTPYGGLYVKVALTLRVQS